VKAYNNGRIASLEMNNGDVVNVARTKKKEVVQRLSDN
jgi:hypothetical protein